MLGTRWRLGVAEFSCKAPRSVAHEPIPLSAMTTTSLEVLGRTGGYDFTV